MEQELRYELEHGYTIPFDFSNEPDVGKVVSDPILYTLSVNGHEVCQEENISGFDVDVWLCDNYEIDMDCTADGSVKAEIELTWNSGSDTFLVDDEIYLFYGNDEPVVIKPIFGRLESIEAYQYLLIDTIRRGAELSKN